MFRTLADAGINIEMITTSEIRITQSCPKTA
jgi:aspartokinase